jgi:hypothetical protein
MLHLALPRAIPVAIKTRGDSADAALGLAQLLARGAA